LPIDPENQAEGRKYYSYIVGSFSGGNYLLSSPIESEKHLQGVAVNDGGTDASRFEAGTNINLWADASLLTAYWRLDEVSGTVASDSSNNSNDGNWFGTGSHTTTGKIGTAGYFDGDDYVSLPVDILNGLSEFTLSFWFKTDVIDDMDGVFCFEKSDHTWRFCAFNDQVRFRDNDGLTHDIDLFPSVTMEADIWYHVALVYDGTNRVFTPYINSSSLGDISVGTAMYSDMGSARLGLPLDAGYEFYGAIDDVRIYSRALELEEVSSIYDSAK